MSLFSVYETPTKVLNSQIVLDLNLNLHKESRNDTLNH